MVRTKGEAATSRVSGAKAPRKIAIQQPSAGKSWLSGAGGNPYCPRETPVWQKEITKFFPKVDNIEAPSSSGKIPTAAEDSTSQEPEKDDGAGPLSHAEGLCDSGVSEASSTEDVGL